MGSFSISHWIIALVLLAASAAFVYLLGSLLWKGASKRNLVVAAVTFLVAALAVFAIVKAASTPAGQAATPTDRAGLRLPLKTGVLNPC